ncbi:MAG: hypothetical protein JWO19_3936 [Bryobacterales bacterium]|jgi:hypothetical protein|nr:hypothetical protein [Bryobacterales bacterium]
MPTARGRLAVSGLKCRRPVALKAVEEPEGDAEGFQMIKNLYQRLERLEEQIIPAGELRVVQIVYVDSDGSEETGPRVELPPCSPF